ncbi:MAG TPA: glycoside hydrolase family 130 protein [Bryobacteraceae bacterium]|nr:glycoside hydrolase family 130 protein [Bryobacteraceae bacterium]
MEYRTMRATVLLLLAAHLAGAQIAIDATRLSAQPVLEPGPPWSSTGLFNPTAVGYKGKTVLLFRATNAQTISRIGYAESADGLHFKVRPHPVLEPETPYELGGGVEDPRLVRIAGTFYLTYTGYNGKDAQLCLATSKDLIHWQRHGVILPAYKGSWNTKWTKSGAILPQKVKDRWWMYYLGTRTDPDGQDRDYMGLANSPDLLHWTDATAAPVLPRRPGAFDSRVMEPGPAPILTSAGILLLYNGASDSLVYGPAWALFDRDDPSKLIARADRPFLLPELEWEKNGVVPNVIFLEGAIVKFAPGGDIDATGYYGAADHVTGAARLKINIRK